MADFPLSIDITAEDKFSNEVNKILKQSENLVNSSTQRISSSSIAMGTFMGGALSTGMNGLANFMKSTADEMLSFNKTMTETAAKFQMDLNTEEGQRQFKELENSAKKFGETTEFSHSAVAGAYNKMSMAGLDYKESMELMPSAINLATAAGLDLASATDIATDAMGALGLETSDFNKLSDQLAKTTVIANTDLSQMFEALKVSGPTFTNASQSMSTLNAGIGYLAQNGMKASLAGTGLSAAIKRLAAPTKGAKDALHELGISTTDNEGNMLDFVDILGELESSMNGMGSAKKIDLLNTIFGDTGGNAVGSIFATGVAGLKEMRGEIENADGSAREMAEAMRKSLSAQIDVLNSSIIGLGMSIWSYLEEPLGDSITILVKLIENIDDVIRVMGFLGTAYLVNVTRLQLMTMWTNRSMMAAKMQTMWTNRAAIAQKAWNFAMAMNPIGLVVTLIATLAAWVIKARMETGDWGEAFSVVFDGIYESAKTIFDFLSGGFGVLSSIVGSLFGSDDDSAQASDTTQEAVAKTNKSENDKAAQNANVKVSGDATVNVNHSNGKTEKIPLDMSVGKQT